MKTKSNDANRRRSYCTSTLLLLAINVPLAGLVAVLLFTDYHREMRRSTDERRLMLTEEAALIGTALLTLSNPENPAAIKSYLARSCSQSVGHGKSGHWIDAQWNGESLHTHAGPDHDSRRGETEATITGSFVSGDLQVDVSERAAEIRRSARGGAISRLSGIVAMGALAGLIADIVLVRLIADPTQRLIKAVEQLRSKNFEFQPQYYRSHELNQLSLGITRMAESLKQAEANHETAMRRARDIQNHLLPQEICVPGLSFVTHFQPAEDVAGDIYGVLELRDRSWLIYIADLVGHGIPAAISAAVVKMLIESAAGASSDPGGIMRRVNQLLPQYLAEGEFATAAILRWHPDTAKLTFASAGHEPVLLVTQHRLLELQATGIPLGVDTTACWSTTNHTLAAGDRLMLATDGVAETFDSDDQQFGRERLAKMFNNSHAGSIEEFSACLVEQLERHRGVAPVEDDMTFLIAECRNPESATGPLKEIQS